MTCLKEGRRTHFLGETSRTAWERIGEHLASLKRCLLEPTRKDLEEAGPLQKHQWLYHPGSRPEYWAKVVTKHFTAFSRQVREGVLIARMEPTVDIILNSKTEIVGTRIGRKKVQRNGEVLELVEGDATKLTSAEKKLVAELEEGDEVYQDKELWEAVTRTSKRKPEINNTWNLSTTDMAGGTRSERSPKRQRLITDWTGRHGPEVVGGPGTSGEERWYSEGEREAGAPLEVEMEHQGEAREDESQRDNTAGETGEPERQESKRDKRVRETREQEQGRQESESDRRARVTGGRERQESEGDWRARETGERLRVTGERET